MMMKKRWWWLVIPAVLLGLLWIGDSVAQSLGERFAEKAFERADSDHDGRVTRDELPNGAWFGRLDANEDGVITKAEARQNLGPVLKPSPAIVAGGSEGRVGAIFDRLDRNGDGRLDSGESEVIAGLRRTLDGDQDGIITREEAVASADRLSRLRDEMPGTADLPEVDLADITSGPELRTPADAGIGRQVPDITLTDIQGNPIRLAEMAAAGEGLVVAYTSVTCPLSKRYAQRLAELEKDLRGQGVGMILVNPFASEKAAAIEADIADRGFVSPYVRDEGMRLSALLGAETTTEAFLLDSKRTLIYRGALDDQFGVTYNLDEPRQTYLLDAVQAMLRDQRPIIAATHAPGCELDVPDSSAASVAGDVTYHRDVARILQQNCVECHREEGIAPFALDGIDEVEDRAKVIRRVVEEGTMPPWFAADTGGETPWANDRALAESDRSRLLAWLNSSDRPMGGPADAPKPLAFADGWIHGKPDEIVQIPRPISVKANGFMPYQNVSVETDFEEDRWVSGYEILPTDRSVVHHVIVQVQERGARGRAIDEASGYWAAYVPGNSGHLYPQGFARKLPAGARVRFQIHYTPSGKATEDQLMLGLHFADSPPRYEVRTSSVVGRRLDIPPGAANHVETASRRVPFDMPVTAYMAHMHVRGKAFRYEVEFPDGGKETLLDIPRYDFNWQLRYDYKEPRIIPAGSQITVTAVFDNSAGNPANPDPGKRVRWGQQTVDEMLIGYVEYFVPLSEAAQTAQN